jgi:hypothetical protein
MSAKLGRWDMRLAAVETDRLRKVEADEELRLDPT